MDENFQTYLHRALRLTLPETYQAQAPNTLASAKYQAQPEGGFRAVPFPGYTIVTPTGPEDGDNQALFDRLTQFQQTLVEQIGPEVLAPVPSDSFHLTLADLIWDTAYTHAAAEPGFEAKLQDQIAQIFQECQSLTNHQPIKFEVLGLMLMTRAIAVCLAPADEASYERILTLRRAIYQHQSLIGLGIEQQYYFTPHISLGYFGSVPSPEQRAGWASLCDRWNQQWLEGNPKEFWVRQAELRKFDDMDRYYRQSAWAVLQF